MPEGVIGFQSNTRQGHRVYVESPQILSPCILPVDIVFGRFLLHIAVVMAWVSYFVMLCCVDIIHLCVGEKPQHVRC